MPFSFSFRLSCAEHPPLSFFLSQMTACTSLAFPSNFLSDSPLALSPLTIDCEHPHLLPLLHVTAPLFCRRHTHLLLYLRRPFKPHAGDPCRPASPSSSPLHLNVDHLFRSSPGDSIGSPACSSCCPNQQPVDVDALFAANHHLSFLNLHRHQRMQQESQASERLRSITFPIFVAPSSINCHCRRHLPPCH
ncbi:hypothetical protein COCNU_16G003140 [Cocos nucifera]|uniref:Uncharacterized protein n=1 Tax=Cocos nucifera TaxID=13894 RepID=A0A8K0IY89_COCNU|nr:hypothetical protein COCNU_16G003140 [Cocos nucifera]